MKNRIEEYQSIGTKIPSWVYEEGQEDDFLLGKTPQSMPERFEEEE